MSSDDKKGLAKDAEKRRINILRSGNNQAVLDTISEIREKGSINELPEILELLLATSNSKVIDACRNLLNDLKNEECVPILVQTLKEKRFLPIRTIVVSSCWQNGLDYSSEVVLFANILAEDEYSSAIEALTVIENSLANLEDKNRIQLLMKLKDQRSKADEEKKKLLDEMIRIVNSF